MDVEQQNYLKGSLTQSVVEFFRDYGVECSASEDFSHPPLPPTETEMGSIVGFRGQSLRGGLAFVAPTTLVAQMLPVPPSPARAELQLRDWSAEIANQLLGRLKNKLWARALDFDVGTPVCFRGTSIRLAFLPNADGVSLSFAIASAGVRVYLDCSLTPPNGADEEAALRIVPEGDVVLF